MLSYTIKRVGALIPTMWAIVTIVFLVVRIAPGDPAVAVLGEQASEAALETVRERMGLNEALHVQYLSFLGGILRGDLGTSLVSGRPIGAEIVAVLPHTVQLTFTALCIGVALGIPIGLVTAVYRNRMPDYVGRILSLAGLSFPAFYLAILLILFLAVPLAWLPTMGAGAFTDPLDNIRHLILPAMSLGLISTAYITRVTRSVILNVLSDDHVRTARSKGVAERRVLVRHALQPALLPVVSLVSLFFITLVGSSVLTEIVFARPGMGRLMVNAVMTRDYTMVQACMIVYASIVVLINLFTDLLYGALDPQIRYE